MSVIVPVHNELPHLTETIESALAQELTDFELIAIDDGSSDGSGEELERLARSDDRLAVIRQSGSGWPGGPRNRGLEGASGRYVFFLDGDDKLEPCALGTMVDAIEAADDDAVPIDVVIPKMRGTGGRRISPLFLRYPSGDIALDRAMETLTPQKMIRREMIEREGLRFPEGVVRLEDGIFMTQVYTAARRITYSGERVLYLFAKRDRGGNTSSRLFRPDDYVESCRVIATTLVENVADSEEASRLASEFFGKMGLRFYTPRRWRLSHPWRRRAWVRAHRRFLDDFVPEELDAREAHPTDRAKRALIRGGRVRGLTALINAERRLDHGAELIAAEGDEELDLVVELSGTARRSLLGRARSAVLMLGGYRPGRNTAVSSEALQHSNGRVSARFVLPEGALSEFRGDRAALWTAVTLRDGRGSGRARLRAKEAFSARRKGVRVFSNKRGGVGIDLRE